MYGGELKREYSVFRINRCYKQLALHTRSEYLGKRGKGGDRVKKTAVVVIAFVLLMMSAVVSPVFASQPKTSYQWAEISISVNPGKQWTTDTSILHQRGSESNNWMFGLPWGNTPVDAPGTVIADANFNLATLNGGGISKFSDSVPGGTLEGSTPWKVTGAGLVIYDGIDITGGPFPLAHDTPLGGLLFKGTFEAHGTGDLGGIKVKGEYVGVSLSLPDGTPIGINVVWGTATYMVTGAGK